MDRFKNSLAARTHLCFPEQIENLSELGVRRSVMKDALALFQSGILEPATEEYGWAESNLVYPYIAPMRAVHSNITTIRGCPIGALFFAYTSRIGRNTIGECSPLTLFGKQSFYLMGEVIFPILRKIFDPADLILLDAAYSGGLDKSYAPTYLRIQASLTPEAEAGCQSESLRKMAPGVRAVACLRAFNERTGHIDFKKWLPRDRKCLPLSSLATSTVALPNLENCLSLSVEQLSPSFNSAISSIVAPTLMDVSDSQESKSFSV